MVLTNVSAVKENSALMPGASPGSGDVMENLSLTRGGPVLTPMDVLGTTYVGVTRVPAVPNTSDVLRPVVTGITCC